MAQTYFAVLMERTIPDYAFSSFMDISMRAGSLGFARINIGYTRIDVARNTLVAEFVKQAKNDDDTLVMMDCDHMHPDTIVERLARHDEGVVVALAFRRCVPYDPQIYRFNTDGNLVQPSEWGQGLLKIDAFGCAAVAMKRWVFKKLDEAGINYPWFRFWYPKGMGLDNKFPSEDIYFGLACGNAGVECYCDTTVVSPHLTVGTVQDDTWQAYLADHPEFLMNAQPVPAGMREKLGMEVRDEVVYGPPTITMVGGER